MSAGPRGGKTHKETAVRLPCACANLRRAARAVTQFYDQLIRPSGLGISQFTLLQALHLAPGNSQKQLAELLATDSTTLTRTLGFLRRRNWLRAEREKDRRQLRLLLTPAGEREYRRVLPYWQAAQWQLRHALGEASWNLAISAAVRVAGANLTAARPAKIAV
jgi:DNA-binding MarR family transcriptional regulator